MKKLLVPCDFSKPAIHAFKFALDIAAKSANAKVHVLYIIEVSAMHDSILMPVLSFEEQIFNDAQESAEKEFKQLNKKWNTESVDVVFEVLVGKVSEGTQQYTREHAIDAIIMGSHGATGMKEFFVGSNAEKIVRHAEVPVIVLKEEFRGSIKNIVFPNTLQTENQENLVQKVKALQHFFKAHLHIVWINTPVNFTPDSVTRKRLTDFVNRFQFKDYTINIYNHLNAEDGIAEFSDTIDSPLIAMGTHGRKGFAHLIHGSLTESLVNHSEKIIWSYVMTESTADVSA